jgi:Flp pilus assembly pilin Flp
MYIPRITPGGEMVSQPGAGAPTESDQQLPAAKRRRRGATAMEYLLVASFILVVVISAVQYFGYKTNQLMSKSAAATKPK